MKPEETAMICIQDEKTDKWSCYLKNITGVHVQVDHIREAPDKMGDLLAEWLKLGFRGDIHEIYGKEDANHPMNDKV